MPVANEILLLLLPVVGTYFIITGCLLTYSDRYFKYWYGNEEFSKESFRYYMARYWTGQRSVF